MPLSFLNRRATDIPFLDRFKAPIRAESGGGIEAEACGEKISMYKKIYIFIYVREKKNRSYASLYNLTYTISPLCLSLVFIYAIIHARSFLFLLLSATSWGA